MSIRDRIVRISILAALLLFPHLATSAQDSFPESGIHGSLVIVGGGSIPDTVYGTFMKLAGETDARLVVIPTASARADKLDTDTYLQMWRARNPKSVVVLHTRSREMANDPDFVAPLLDATAVWFGGGQQSRLSNSYAGTKVEAALLNLLKRGGVIGGTSAGAAIMSRTMISSGRTSAKLGTGLDLLPGVVIDQHFLMRNRFQRLIGVIHSHPQLVGIGIDESTAIHVKGTSITVLGESFVTTYIAATVSSPPLLNIMKKGDSANLVSLSNQAQRRTSSAQ